MTQQAGHRIICPPGNFFTLSFQSEHIILSMESHAIPTASSDLAFYISKRIAVFVIGKIIMNNLVVPCRLDSKERQGVLLVNSVRALGKQEFEFWPRPTLRPPIMLGVYQEAGRLIGKVKNIGRN